MKNNLIFVALMLILSGANSCSSKNETSVEYTVEYEKIYISETEYVLWSVVPYKVSKKSENRLILENHTERVVQFGEMFSLDYFYKGEWIPLDLTNQSWTDIGSGIRPGETREGYANTMLLYFVKEYNNSKKGKYRMGRLYSVYSVGNPGNMYEFSFTLYAEFVIK